MGLPIHFLRSIQAHAFIVGGRLTPALNLDLTSSLDSKITFTRAGTRNYINGGVLTALATGTPAFESWGGVNRGLAIEPAFTNLITYSNDFTNAAWTYTGASTAVAGDAGSGVMTQLASVSATAVTSTHQIRRKPGSVAAGVRQTWQGFVKVGTSASNYSCYLRMSNEFNNSGLTANFRLDGSDGFIPVQDATMVTDGVFSYRKLSGGVYQVALTGTWVSTGNKQFEVGVSANALPGFLNYAGTTTEKVQVYGFSLATANGPVGYVETGAATASQAAESAVFNDTSWMASTAQGTFIVEHDCWSGTLIGSGTNVVLASTVTGKTAIAWSGVTSDTVNNGGDTTAGVQPTFSGSDVRLLSTSSTSNAGHIKSIKFYPTRLSVAEMQLLTAPTLVSTATPNVLRGVSTKNRLPSIGYTTAGNVRTGVVGFEMPVGAFPLSEIRLDFPNISFPGVPAGNSLTIEECWLERRTGVNESVQVKYGGNNSFVVPDGAAASFVSDAILPTSFTGLTEFPGGTLFYLKMRYSVTTAGHKIVGSRSRYDTNAFCILFDPAITFTSALSALGDITRTGAVPINDDYGYSPIMVGKFVLGDPKTCFTVGDSIVQGIVSTTHQGPGLYIKKACMALGVPNIEHSRGGQSQRHVGLDTSWTPYLKYARVLIDEMGTNDPNALLDFFTYWAIARNTHNYDKIMRSGLTPICTSSDSFATEANQTITITKNFPTLCDSQMAELKKYGMIDANYIPSAMRGSNFSKWVTNGTAFYATADGTHPSVAADNLEVPLFQAALAAITVT